MASLIFVLVWQMILVAVHSSDKHLKDVPKIEQRIVTESENETDTVVVMAPQVIFCLNDTQVNSGGTGESVLPETVQDQTVEAVSFCLGSPESSYSENIVYEAARTINRQSSIGDIPTESANLDSQTLDETNNVDVDNCVGDAVTRNHPATASYGFQLGITPSEALHEEELEVTQLDPMVADARISDLRSSVYQKLGDALEKINTFDGVDPWWNYLILQADDLDISRRDQRSIEERRRPGLEFLDILDEIGFTLRQLENLLMRFQMYEVLHILRTNQFVVEGRRRNTYTSSQQNDGQDDNPAVSNQNRDLNNERDRNIDKIHENRDGTVHPKEDVQTDRENRPCRDNACFEEGTHSCSYNGMDGGKATCNCKVGFDGDQCENKHSYAKYFPDVVDSCNERGLSQNECIADTFDIETDDYTLENLGHELLKKDVVDVARIVLDKVAINGEKLFSDFFTKQTNGNPLTSLLSGLFTKQTNGDQLASLLSGLFTKQTNGDQLGKLSMGFAKNAAEVIDINNDANSDAKVTDVVDKFQDKFKNIFN